jgi:hypothetical protein
MRGHPASSGMTVRAQSGPSPDEERFMAQGAHTETIPVRKRKIVLCSLVTATVVFTAVAAILLFSRANTGDRLIREGSAEDVREAVKILLDSYTSLITLVTAAFGAVAFLLTFQQTQGRTVTTRAWIILTTGVVLLTLALFLAFVGREELLIMMTHNAVDITFPLLSITRWLCYSCTVVAAIMVLSFAVEVAVSLPEGTSHVHPGA